MLTVTPHVTETTTSLDSLVPGQVDDGVVGGRQTGGASPHVDVPLAVSQTAQKGSFPGLLQRQKAGGGGDGQRLGTGLLLGL